MPRYHNGAHLLPFSGVLLFFKELYNGAKIVQTGELNLFNFQRVRPVFAITIAKILHSSWARNILAFFFYTIIPSSKVYFHLGRASWYKSLNALFKLLYASKQGAEGIVDIRDYAIAAKQFNGNIFPSWLAFL